MSTDMDKDEKIVSAPAEAEAVAKTTAAEPPPDQSSAAAAEAQSIASPAEAPSSAAAAEAPSSAPESSSEDESKSQQQSSEQNESPKQKIKGFIRECVELVVFTLILLVIIRGALAEARYIPSSSMEPTLQINDRILVEKVSGWMMRPIERGDILVFYPPPIELGGKDISNSPLYVLGRLTGLPIFPIDTAYIKRVVGLPGEQIRVERGVGVFVNDQFLPEPYIKERPDYDLRVLGDICGRNSVGEFIKPFGDSNEPILVPPGKLLMMGDNRNNSEDGHVWGFLDQKRVIGKSCLLFWRLLPGKPPAPKERDDFFEQ